MGVLGVVLISNNVTNLCFKPSEMLRVTGPVLGGSV